MPFQIIRNDITKVKADAIVNTANPEVCVGDGVDTAIYNAAGRNWLLKEREKIGELPIGEVAVTPAGNLNAKYIFHESGPVWLDGKHYEAEILRSCYEKCLNLALQYKCESIAFPLLASGSYGFPKDISLRIAIDAIKTFLSEHELEIFLVLYDSQAVKLSETMFDGVKSFVDRKFSSMLADYTVECDSLATFELDDLSEADFLFDDEIEESRLLGRIERKNTYNARPVEPTPGKFQVFSSPVPSKPLDVYVDRFENQEILTFGEYLQQLINKKGLTNKEVYFEANLTKQYFSKVIKNKMATPAKEKLLCIAVALKLNIDETNDFLLHAGYAISPYSKIDLVFEYYIRSKKYDVYEISFALEELGIEGGLWPELA